MKTENNPTAELYKRKLEHENSELRKQLINKDAEIRQLRETLATIGYLLQRGDYLDKLNQPQQEKSPEAKLNELVDKLTERGYKIVKKTDNEFNNLKEEDEQEETPPPQPVKKTRPRVVKRTIEDEVLEDLEKDEAKATKQPAHREGETAKTASQAASIAKAIYGNKKITINLKKQADAAAQELEGEDGNKEYKRLEIKEKTRPGSVISSCPHCGEKLEEPITRGYHTECYNAVLKKQSNF